MKQTFPDSWDLKTKIEFLQRKIIFNSIVYYEFDDNLISDKDYDDISRQLVELCKEYGDVSNTQYGYAMNDFDGTTGFDLVSILTPKDRDYLIKIVRMVLHRTAGRHISREMTVVKNKKEIIREPFLRDYQYEAVRNLANGKILNGGTGSGKSRTGLYYWFSKNGGKINEYGYEPMKLRQDLYIITTAKKRDDLDWQKELVHFLLSDEPGHNVKNKNVKIVIDSWNNIKKYADVGCAFFLFDEQKVSGSGAWVKTFLKIVKNNDWILLSATPADRWEDYIPVFVANGFYKNRTEFSREHLVYSRFAKFPKVDGYMNERKLRRLRDDILVDMDFQRSTVQHHEDIFVNYDISKYRDVMRNRWDPFKNEPIQQASALCYTLRRVVNTDESRIVALMELLEKHHKAIIFYNHDPELELMLDALKPFGEVFGYEVAQWNGHKHERLPTSDKWVYLVNYSSCEGWNCITTDTIIFFSQTYSYKVLQQAIGRVDRMNTPFTDLYYYHLRSRSGIDLAITKALKNKKQFNERKFAGFD